YSAPHSVITTPQTVTVTATSVANGAKIATATITLNPVAISVSPTATTVYTSQLRQVTPVVIYANPASVTWTINPPGVGRINAAGLYSAPPTVASPQTVTLTATSVADPSKSASATVKVSNPPISTGTAQGRYVRVQLSGADFLQLGEVQVFGAAGTNLAQGKAASQSSTYPYATTGAGSAVDG